MRRLAARVEKLEDRLDPTVFAMLAEDDDFQDFFCLEWVEKYGAVGDWIECPSPLWCGCASCSDWRAENHQMRIEPAPDHIEIKRKIRAFAVEMEQKFRPVRPRTRAPLSSNRRA